jgi:hypothetical protein
MPPMPGRSRRRLTLTRGLLLTGALAALGGCGSGGRSEAGGSVVPVVTSIIADTVPTGSAPAGTRPPSAAGGALGTVPRGYGEAETPVEVPTTAPAVIGPEADAVSAAARGFLGVFWAGGTRTFGQLADELAPFSTDKLLGEYRRPPRSERAMAEQAVRDPTVEIKEAGDTAATAVGRGTSTTGTRQGNVWLTLALVKDEAGAWKVDSIR